ncbi:hypothetical protein V1477_018952 [Vespula maculifrons]|uniref:Uncharacterized protein n=1 Tax=Vespula maculifrons TaxID=7453 RepID=A0ABD2ATA2_VESMC
MDVSYTRIIDAIFLTSPPSLLDFNSKEKRPESRGIEDECARKGDNHDEYRFSWIESRRDDVDDDNDAATDASSSSSSSSSDDDDDDDDDDVDDVEQAKR